jgi:hypothetical protein
MRECPDCGGRRVPCATCQGRRIVEGEPRSEAEASRVRIAESVLSRGLRETYERLRDHRPLSDD